MTYNFDPERWLEAHRAVLETCRDRGEIDDVALEEELKELDQRYDDLVERLDGTYQIPVNRKN